jgi:hypothetical protein
MTRRPAKPRDNCGGMPGLAEWRNALRCSALRLLEHAEPMNRKIVDFDGPEPGFANDQAADRQPSDRQRADGKSAQRRGAEG